MFQSVLRTLAVIGIFAGSFGLGPASVSAESLEDLKVRKNVCDLTPQERADFVEAVKTLKATYRPGSEVSIYDEYVTWHRDSMPAMAAHMTPAFLPWHREFLRRFEQDLQSVNPNVTIPYWDFTNDHLDDDCLWTDDFMGGNGDPEDQHIVKTGPFRAGEWELTVFDDYDAGPDFPTDANLLPHLTRGFGSHPGGDRLPTYGEIITALGIPTYDVEPWDETSNWTCSFRNYLEGWRVGTNPLQRGPHNLVHNWVGGRFGEHDGTAAQNGTSPNDPVFWLLHANVDRIWAEWTRRYGPQYLPITEGHHPGQNLNDPMWPWFDVTPADLLDHHALGYRYDIEGPEAFPEAVTGGTMCLENPLAVK